MIITVWLEALLAGFSADLSTRFRARFYELVAHGMPAADAEMALFGEIIAFARAVAASRPDMLKDIAEMGDAP